MDLTDKIAIVTGSSKGIGRAAAIRLAAAGTKVCINAHKDIEGGKEVERTLREAGRECFFRPADVTNKDQVQALVDEVLGRWGKIDVLVNNAGISGDGPTSSTLPATTGTAC